MFPYAFAFLLGDIILQLLADIPAWRVLIIINIFLFIIYLHWRFQKIIYLIFFLIGLIYSSWFAENILQKKLSPQLENKKINIDCLITAIPITNNFTTQLQCYVANLNLTAKIYWNHPTQNLLAGQHWKLRVKLKRIHGTQNPNSVDIERMSLLQNIQAIGYVIYDSKNQLLATNYGHVPLTFIRQWLYLKLQTILPQSPTSHWLPALMLGERQGIAANEWQVLRRTGTNHLMAIAGLHIGFVVGLTYVIVSFIWRRFSILLLWIPTQYAAITIASCVGILYGALAGFSIPTVRACCMLIISTYAYLRKKNISHWDILGLTLFFILLINPLQILANSFWLSFITIVFIFYGMQGRLHPQGWWWRYGRVQWVISLGILPLSFVFFDEGAMYSLIANAISIPWLLFSILPFCLFAIFVLPISITISKILLFIADTSLGFLWKLLIFIKAAPFAIWSMTLPNFIYIFYAVFVIVLLLLPRGMPGRLLSVIWILPIIFYQAPRPDARDVWLNILDVGQGLAVVIQTKHHTLLYDAGPNYREADMGERIVVPFLKLQNRLDAILISHNDNDHIGGKNAVLNAFPNANELTCEPRKVWEWDGVIFTILHPINDMKNKNDNSCVLRISNGVQQILLPGDIEKKGEKNLIQTVPNLLSANILIAPHHGSKTSSSKAFVKYVHPQYVIYSVGYQNRFHFPNFKVMQRYTDATQWQTQATGMLKFKLLHDDNQIEVTSYRDEQKHYWLQKYF